MEIEIKEQHRRHLGPSKGDFRGVNTSKSQKLTFPLSSFSPTRRMVTCMEVFSRGVGERDSGCTTAPAEAAAFCFFPCVDSSCEEFTRFFTPEDILGCDVMRMRSGSVEGVCVGEEMGVAYP